MNNKLNQSPSSIVHNRRPQVFNLNHVFLFLLLLASLGACSALPTPTEVIAPVVMSTPTVTQTSTVIWFPPTATLIPLPATPLPQPTIDLRPGLGEVILDDDFSKTTNWGTRRTQSGSIAYGNQELTIAIASPKSLLNSQYQKFFPDNYYLEITASPSLCRGSDMYGLMLRINSEADYYRIGANCNGQIRMDWIKSGAVTPIHGWTLSGQVMPGPYSELTMGVWAVGDEIRFFINDTFQFSANNLRYRSGNLGVFARSAGETALTVNFSDLIVYQINDLTQPALPALEIPE
jgi:hypothetical protein